MFSEFQFNFLNKNSQFFSPQNRMPKMAPNFVFENFPPFFSHFLRRIHLQHFAYDGERRADDCADSTLPIESAIDSALFAPPLKSGGGGGNHRPSPIQQQHRRRFCEIGKIATPHPRRSLVNGANLKHFLKKSSKILSLQKTKN